LKPNKKPKVNPKKNLKSESPSLLEPAGAPHIPNMTADLKDPVESTIPSPATVWPAIDSSSVKTPPPPNHQSHKKAPPPRPRQTKPPTSGTPEKQQTAQAVPSKPPLAGPKAKDQPLIPQQPKSNTKHYPAKHPKKLPIHSEAHTPNKVDALASKSPDKENPNTGQVSKDIQSNLSAAKENQGPLTKEKADPISTPSYADIARSTTPTNTPSNSTGSD